MRIRKEIAKKDGKKTKKEKQPTYNKQAYEQLYKIVSQIVKVQANSDDNKNDNNNDNGDEKSNSKEKLTEKEIYNSCKALIEIFELFYNNDLISKIVLNEDYKISLSRPITMEQNGPYCGTSIKRNFWIIDENGDPKEYTPVVPSSLKK